ncbi:MAG: hypothetical protein ABIK15_13345 [Pseudomonadota bacterium]
MTVISQELEQSLNQYDEMQSLHFQAISGFRNHAPDMKDLNFQRSRAFEDLKNQLRCHLETRRTDSRDSVKQEFMYRLENIINKEKVIACLTAEYRQAIIRQKSRMGQGKRALKGYGNACVS